MLLMIATPPPFTDVPDARTDSTLVNRKPDLAGNRPPNVNRKACCPYTTRGLILFSHLFFPLMTWGYIGSLRWAWVRTGKLRKMRTSLKTASITLCHPAEKNGKDEVSMTVKVCLWQTLLSSVLSAGTFAWRWKRFTVLWWTFIQTVSAKVSWMKKLKKNNQGWFQLTWISGWTFSSSSHYV